MLYGVLDRIENGKATILIENTNDELIIYEVDLPEGSHEGTWFSLKKENDTYHILEIATEKTAHSWEKSKQLMDQLKAKKRTSRFKR